MIKDARDKIHTQNSIVFCALAMNNLKKSSKGNKSIHNSIKQNKIFRNKFNQKMQNLYFENYC